MIALLLFKPRENFQNTEHIRYHHTLYCRLLRRYLEHKYRNVHQANRKYFSLLRLANTFDHILENSRKMVMADIDLRELPHIMVEVLGLSLG